MGGLLASRYSRRGFGVPASIPGLHRCRAARPVRPLCIPGSTGLGAGGAAGRRKGSACARASNLPLVGEAAPDGRLADVFHARQLGLVCARRVPVLLGLRVAVEVQVGHDVPLGLAGGEGAAQAEHLACEHPPDEPDGVAALVVGRDGYVDELSGAVGVAEPDDGDVDVAGLLDGLGVGARVRHDDESRFLERARDVVGEVAWGEAAGDGDGASVRGEFEDGALAVGACADHTNVGGVVDGSDDARG